MPTTRKDTASVPVKIDIVARDRGCRCGGMVQRNSAAIALAALKLLLASIEDYIGRYGHTEAG